MATTKKKWLTREEVAKLLGVHASTVRRMERRGELHATKNEHGHHMHAFSEVIALLARRAREHVRTGHEARDEGEDASRAFQMFRDAKSVNDVVIALKLAPHYVRELYAEFIAPDHTHRPSSRRLIPMLSPRRLSLTTVP